MSLIPDDLKYTNDHEWIRPGADGTAIIGITDHAQNSLGDITFVELPETEDAYSSGDSFGVVESVKAASDLYMPVAGKVIEVNEKLNTSPETVNSDPYGEGWLVRVVLEVPEEMNQLLDAAAYTDLVG